MKEEQAWPQWIPGLRSLAADLIHLSETEKDPKVGDAFRRAGKRVESLAARLQSHVQRGEPATGSGREKSR